MAKILLVDDSEELLNVLEIILSQKEVAVFTATSVNNAKQILSANDIDLIILDVWMPEFNGREFCRELKQRVDFKDIKIILFSASKELLKDFKQCGADDILEKPFDIATITEKVNTLLFS